MSKQQIRPFNDDVYLILQKAGQYSQKYYHTYIGTAHTFLATFAFLSSQKETQKYGKIYETLKGLLNEVGINGPEFEKNFLLASPRGEEPSENEEFSITADIEYKRVTDGLTRKAFEEKRSMEVEDLIVELFADKSFVLFSIFSMVTGSDQITENLYNTIVKAFKREKKPVSNDLDKIPELTNLNRFVEENPQTIIGAEKVLNQLFPVLCGRVNPNALLIGPAGTGKTTFVYALAQAINRGEVPSGLKNKRIFQLDPTALVSGTRYRGKQNCLSW